MIELNNDQNNEPSPYLQKEALSATLSNEDIRKLYENMIKDEALKNYTFPKKPSSDGYYHIYVNDATKKTGRSALKAKSLTELKNKVYEHEIGKDGTILNRVGVVYPPLSHHRTCRSAYGGST